MNKLTSLFLIFLLFSQSLSSYVKYDGSRLIPLSYAPYEAYNANLIVSTSNLSQEMISYYSWFAAYGYCDDAEVPNLCCKSYKSFFTSKWTIVSESSISGYFTYNFILWRSDTYKKYILTFPGTRNKIVELLTEAANIKLVNYNGVDNGIKVVNYFNQVAMAIKDIIWTQQVLNDINKHPTYQFVLTGHSLGAAVASLVLYDAVNRNIIKSANQPALVAYGMPRTGNKNWVVDFNSKIKNVLRVVRNSDVVTNLPTTLWNSPYYHLGGLVMLNKDVTEMYYCPQDIGEGYSDKVCKTSISFDVKYHSYYFNPDVKFSDICETY